MASDSTSGGTFGGTVGTLPTGSRAAGCAGIGPTANRSFSGAAVAELPSQRLEDVPLEERQLLRPRRRLHRDMERSVAADPERPRVPRNRVSDGGRPGTRHLGEGDGVATAAARQLLLDLVADAVHQRTSPGITDSDCVGSPGSAAAAVAVTTVCAPREIIVGERCSALSVELREHVVEEHERRHPTPLSQRPSLGHDEREHGDALFTLRAEHAEVPPARLDPQVVQVRACAGHATVEVGVEARVEIGDGRRLAFVHQRMPTRGRGRPRPP